MILGVGIDLIEVTRIDASYQKYGERFLRRVLREPEIQYCFSHRNPAPFLAARFAAKEAISKAFGTGIGRQLGWQDMEVRHKSSGQPYAVLHGNGQKLMEDIRGQQLHLSLSHTLHYATAVAVLEGSG
jgi:holo-[acyl-carrier protein] synthase